MNEKVLDEAWYNSCINCGKTMSPKDPYDFWCSGKCKEKCEAEIKKLGEEYAEALGAEKQAGEKK